MASRIAIVTTSYPAHPGDAAGHFVAAKARALAGAGHAVTVITGGAPSDDAGNPRVVRLADGGASGWPGLLPRLRTNPVRALGLLRWALKARRELERRGPFDRVIAEWLLPSGFPIAGTASLCGAELEIVVHGSDARLLARLPGRFTRPLFDVLIRRGAHFSCVSEELAELLERAAGRRLAPRLSVEMPLLELREAPNRSVARTALKLEERARLIVVVGRLIAGKRTREALVAASLLPDTEVVVVGDGPELSALRAEFPNVRFTGRVDRSIALFWIGAADVVLSASRDEGAPTALREARALGVPVVTTTAGDLRRKSLTDAQLVVID